MKKFQVITLFPEMFTGVFENSMMWKAQKDEIVELSCINLREFGLGPRRSVDDTPYGGGDGMLLRIEPLWNAVQSATTGEHDPSASKNATNTSTMSFTRSDLVEGVTEPSLEDSSDQSAIRTDLIAGETESSAEESGEQGAIRTDLIANGVASSMEKRTRVLLMTPRGKRWTQAMAKEYAGSGDDYVFICGRYEGYDERILELVDEEISVGDYVLTGGELPAMTIIDSIVRLLPGVLGGENSAEIESFSDGETLEFPQYTRPEEFQGMKVPEVLLSGHHGEIAKWRAEQSKKSAPHAD